MIEKNHPRLSIGTQCRLLSTLRQSFYYIPQGETEMNLAFMHRLTNSSLRRRISGVQQMIRHLRNEGHAVNVKRIRRLMRIMPI